MLAVQRAQRDGGHILLGRLGQAEDGGRGAAANREGGQAAPQAAHFEEGDKELVTL